MATPAPQRVFTQTVHRLPQNKPSGPLPQSPPTHVCAFIPAPAARVVSSCHLCPDSRAVPLIDLGGTPTTALRQVAPLAVHACVHIFALVALRRRRREWCKSMVENETPSREPAGGRAPSDPDTPDRGATAQARARARPSPTNYQVDVLGLLFDCMAHD